jgi:hypothetical protein
MQAPPTLDEHIVITTRDVRPARRTRRREGSLNDLRPFREVTLPDLSDLSSREASSLPLLSEPLLLSEPCLLLSDPLLESSVEVTCQPGERCDPRIPAGTRQRAVCTLA